MSSRRLRYVIVFAPVCKSQTAKTEIISQNSDNVISDPKTEDKKPKLRK